MDTAIALGLAAGEYLPVRAGWFFGAGHESRLEHRPGAGADGRRRCRWGLHRPPRGCPGGSGRFRRFGRRRLDSTGADRANRPDAPGTDRSQNHRLWRGHRAERRHGGFVGRIRIARQANPRRCRSAIGRVAHRDRLEPSPDTQLQMLQAKSAVEAAEADLEQTRRRFSDHLATNQDLLRSEQNMQLAQIKTGFAAKGRRGRWGATRKEWDWLPGRRAGRTSRPGGRRLVEIAAGRRLQVRLGVEPSEAASIHVGDAVSCG